jgi:hypothetical protein
MDLYCFVFSSHKFWDRHNQYKFRHFACLQTQFSICQLKNFLNLTVDGFKNSSQFKYQAYTRGRHKKCLQILVRKSERKRTLGRPRCKLEENIRNGVERCGLDASGSENGLTDTITVFRVPEKAENFLTSWVTISFSRRTLLRGLI